MLNNMKNEKKKNKQKKDVELIKRFRYFVEYCLIS